MLFDDIYRAYLDDCRHISNLAPRTIITYRHWISTFSEWADKEGVAPDLTVRFSGVTLKRFVVHLSKSGLRPRTIRSAIGTLRALGNHIVAQNLLPENPARTIPLPKKDAAHRPLASDEELAGLLAATERQADPFLVARDRALFSVMVYCGLRFHELLNIRAVDVSADCRSILVASGKGRKPRTLWTNDTCRVALSEWMRVRQKRHPKHEWCWVCDARRRVGENGLRALLQETKARAGLADHTNILPHAARRAYATRCLANGMDLRSLSASLGHSDPSTTLAYTFDRERPAEQMRLFSELKPSGSSPVPVQEAPPPPSPPKQNRAEMVSRMRRRPAR